MLKIYKRGETPDAELVRREAGAATVTDTVAAIIADVRQNGDAALLAYNARFDRAEGVALEVTAEELDAACEGGRSRGQDAVCFETKELPAQDFYALRSRLLALDPKLFAARFA